MLTKRPRLPDPLIASVIFAPAAREITLSSVTASSGISEALALEWMTTQDDKAIRRILMNRWGDIADINRFFSALCGQLEGAAIHRYGPSVAMSTTLPPQVPGRTFPFARHFDLLGLPIAEGMSFDADDFVEH